jgi:hypothetical protein
MVRLEVRKPKKSPLANIAIERARLVDFMFRATVVTFPLSVSAARLRENNSLLKATDNCANLANPTETVADAQD